ncbi:MAG: hypothetical protein M0D54_04685 [Hyphomonadaceae bacterium JAD_PAG50586_4]|nr:MAG: hypothetical protein M0D54_04685 [Hyphomonadaceae bacterium JAD_PAG50586_4]
MKLWPFYTTSFETTLAPQEAIQRLHVEIGDDKVWVIVGPINASVGSNPERRLFLGHRSANGGEFQNNLNTEPGELRSYNSFQAVVHTRIRPSPMGSRVSSTFRLGAFTVVFMTLWAAPFVWGTFAIADAIGRQAGPSPLFVLFCPAFVVVVWLLVCLSFSEDAEKAERMLRVTLERP